MQGCECVARARLPYVVRVAQLCLQCVSDVQHDYQIFSLLTVVILVHLSINCLSYLLMPVRLDGFTRNSGVNSDSCQSHFQLDYQPIVHFVNLCLVLPITA